MCESVTVKATHNEPLPRLVVKDQLWYVTSGLHVISRPVAIRYVLCCGSGSIIALSDSGCVPNPVKGISTLVLHAGSWSIEF